MHDFGKVPSNHTISLYLWDFFSEYNSWNFMFPIDFTCTLCTFKSNLGFLDFVGNYNYNIYSYWNSFISVNKRIIPLTAISFYFPFLI